MIVFLLLSSFLICCIESICSNPSYNEEINRGHQSMMENTEFNVITKTMLLNRGSPLEAKENIRQYFLDTFDLDTSLFIGIKSNYLWTRADPLRHPVCWYLAHTAAFYINKLRVAQVIMAGINKDFEVRFAIGVDEMSWDDKLEDRDDWPHPFLLFKYRELVKKKVLNVINSLNITLPIKWNSASWAILMGIEHERIHIETSSVLIRQLPINSFNYSVLNNTIWNNICKIGIFNNNLIEPKLGFLNHSPLNVLLPVNGKIVNYGRKIDSTKVYGWDNEFGSMSVEVPSFNASKYLVSNEEYYEFVLNDGYKKKEFWTEEGWKWVKSTKSLYPKFWIKNLKTNSWKLRLMIHEINLPWNWPVVTNQLEANAFTNWKSKKLNKNIRLLTEDEWHVLRQMDEFYANIDQPEWDKAPGNINLEYYASEAPVDMFEFGNTGFYDIIGNVWQHTLSPQHPFEGFTVHPIYDDFTCPCFGSDHNIIKGGSWISTGNEATAYSRYQFRRHFFQHAGIRYIESDRDLKYLEKLSDSSNIYNNDYVVQQYTHFNYYNKPIFGVQNYPKKLVNILFNHIYNKSMISKALDIGCSTGRASFELAKKFNSVDGVDWTARLIGVGYRMQENEFLEWSVPKQGEIREYFNISAKELNILSVLNKVKFTQGDASNLDKNFRNYDLIFASNLIDQLSNPKAFLLSLNERLNINGTLLVCSRYKWTENETPKEHWIGGKYNDEKTKEILTENVLKNILKENNFKLIHEFDIEYILRETERTYTHSLSNCLIFYKTKNTKAIMDNKDLDDDKENHKNEDNEDNKIDEESQNYHSVLFG